MSNSKPNGTHTADWAADDETNEPDESEMMKKSHIAIFALLAACGAVEPDPKDGTPFCEADCEETNNTTNPLNKPVLQGVFVAGHLGSYWDCPQDAYRAESTTSADAAEAPSAGLVAGDCAEGESCGGILNCEDAQATISLTNDSSINAESVIIQRLELVSTDGDSLATLPLMDAFDAETGEPFDGQLEIGETVLLRVEFQGPYSVHELMPESPDGDSRISSGGGAILETTVSSDTHRDLKVESEELYGLPAVAT